MARIGAEQDIAAAIDGYFERMDASLYDKISVLADQLGEMATERLLTTLPECLLTTPVAALDEDKMTMTLNALRPENITVGMGQFNLEAGSVGGLQDSYWVTMNGNTTPKGFQDERAVMNLSPILDVLETEPGFPLGLFLEKYQPKTPICTIRADLNDATIELYRRQYEQLNEQPEDIMIGNFDADTRGVLLMGSNQPYVRQLIDARKQSGAPLLEVYPRLAHQEIDETRFPNMQRLIKWRDYMNTKFGFSFAAHYAVNLAGYLAVGGYDRSWDNNEQLQMGRRLAAHAAETGKRLQSAQLNTVIALVSPRRYVIELANGEHMGYGNLVVPPDGRAVHMLEGQVADLSLKRFKEEVEYEVQRICGRGLEKFATEYTLDNPACSEDEARQRAFEKVQTLIKEENKDMPKIKGMEQTIMRALADFADEHDF